MSRIDRIRRTALTGRPANDVERAEEPPEPVKMNLPVPTRPAAAPGGGQTEGEAFFAAQMLGQDGQKRGLRGGPAVIAAAKTIYNRIEWSGAKDRRTAKGKITRTEV